MVTAMVIAAEDIPLIKKLINQNRYETILQLFFFYYNYYYDYIL